MGVKVAFNYPAWALLYPELVPTTTLASFTGSFASDGTLTVSAVASGALQAGLMALGVGIAANVAIASQLTGTPGGIGTYATNQPAAIGSGPMTASAALACFNQAQVYNRNDGGGPVSTADQQSALMNMVTAHIAALRYGSTQQPPSPLVGRISDAAEGSVSVHTDYPTAAVAGTSSWFNTTPYGAAYWAATAPYRTMRYAALPTIVTGGPGDLFF